MDFAGRMAEEKIQQALREGQLDNLPGKGKPIEIEDLSSMPPEMRMSYLMMKNSGFLPEEVVVRKEIVSIEKMIALCEDPEEKEAYRRKLSEKELKWKMMMEKKNITSTGRTKKYRRQINRLFGS